MAPASTGISYCGNATPTFMKSPPRDGRRTETIAALPAVCSRDERFGCARHGPPVRRRIPTPAYMGGAGGPCCALLKRGAETLDARARILQRLGGGGVGDAEVGPNT